MIIHLTSSSEPQEDKKQAWVPKFISTSIQSQLRGTPSRILISQSFDKTSVVVKKKEWACLFHTSHLVLERLILKLQQGSHVKLDTNYCGCKSVKLISDPMFLPIQMIGDLTLRLTSSKWELPVKEPINRASNLSFHVSLSGTLVSIQNLFEHLAQNKHIYNSSTYCWGLCQYWF